MGEFNYEEWLAQVPESIRGRRFLSPEVFEHRVQLLDEIIAALVLSSGQQRQYRKR